ncbi:MAG: peptidoglycan DD-metalloendopeptidase family protein [Alphaproteobacteria bacterium]|nr:peptidoglycan DD-metalloendopeptidase family protein [Alphaproteobacteria bacterium]
METGRIVRRGILAFSLVVAVALLFIDPGSGRRMQSAGAALIDADFPLSSLSASTLSGDSQLEEASLLPTVKLLAVEPGDTLAQILVDEGAASKEAHAAIEMLKKIYNPRDLRSGQEIEVTFQPSPDGLGGARFMGLSFEPDYAREISVKRGEDGSFSAKEAKKPLKHEIVRADGRIDSSLYEAAIKAGLSNNVLTTMVRVLSYDVDFQRDIQEGDSFSVFFERWFDEKGQPVHDGDVFYLSMTLSGKPLHYYRFKAADGLIDYFNQKGESVKKALLRTPADGARITSKFGKRNHPILGYSRMHKGIDFGLPTGAPIQAAGDGVVEMSGPNSGYGNYLRIRHTNGYATAYAHLSAFAKGVRVGKRVSQGQIVAYVGSTGMSTGPHLHYEVMVNGKQVNPLSVRMPSGRKLAGKELDQFNQAKLVTDKKMAEAPSIGKLAETKQ